MLSYDMMLKGNSIPRTNEDNKHGFRMQQFKRKFDARSLAFDGSLIVAYHFHPKGEGWANKGTLNIKAIEKNPKKPLWTSPPIELVVDDIVLTPKYAYCAGHYQRVKKDPEIWVLSRQDGKAVSTIPAQGFPAFMGMSAAGNRLFVSTRDGKLICFEGKNETPSPPAGLSGRSGRLRKPALHAGFHNLLHRRGKLAGVGAL